MIRRMAAVAAVLTLSTLGIGAPTPVSAAPDVRMVVTPVQAPLGTTRTVRSETPCPGATMVAVDAEDPITYDFVEVRREYFPVAGNGSWSGTIRFPSRDTGTGVMRAACDNGVSYEPVRVQVTTANAGLLLLSPVPTQRDCFCAAPRPATTVQDLGDASFEGSSGSAPRTAPLVGLAVDPTTGLGYWEVASDGGVFAYGTAGFLGSTGAIALNRPIVGMAATPSGLGYWLVAADGGVFAFGDATFLGSTGDRRLNRPIVGMASTPTGLGYWLVASDGGIFAFGDAAFLGSAGSLPLNAPVTGMAATPSGDGYWLVAADGGVFAYGDAPFHGTLGGSRVVALAPHGTGGYWLVREDGGTPAFGDAPALRSCAEGCEPFAGQVRRFVAGVATPAPAPR